MDGKIKKQQSGFSLLEVILGMVLMLTMSVGFLNYSNLGRGQMHDSAQSEKALLIAERVMVEKKRDYVLSGLALTTTLNIDEPELKNGMVDIIVDPPAGAGLKNVKVTVRWNQDPLALPAADRDVSFETYMYRE